MNRRERPLMKRLVLLVTALVCLVPASASALREKVDRRVQLQSALAAPVVRSIGGNPLAINVGDDMSFQIFNAAVPGSGQIFPTACQTTGDMGVFVRIGTTLYAPNFAEHPCGSATVPLGAATAWTPVSISSVTGTGTAADPFSVVVVADAGSTGLRLTMTVTYVNGENFFRENYAFTSTSGPVTFTVYSGADIFLADSDEGVPFYDATSGSPGGKDCATPPTYTILFIPLTPADAYTADSFGTVWFQIGSGSLPSTVSAECQDNGAALQWSNRSVGPNSPLTIQTAASFGTIPTIAQFRVDTVTPSSGNPGQTVTVVVTGIGFQAGTTFNFGAGITVNSTTINSPSQATLSVSIAPGVTTGFRDIVATQSPGGLTSTLPNSFQIGLACGAPVNPVIEPVGNPTGPVTATDFLVVRWQPPAEGSAPAFYEYRINGDTYTRVTDTSAVAPPRGTNDPITLFVRAGCSEQASSVDASSSVYSPAPPVADFTFSAARINSPVTFTDTSSPQATSWLWVFDDGGTANVQSPAHTFTTAGTHRVALIASNGSGSSQTIKEVAVSASTTGTGAVTSSARSFATSDGWRWNLRGVAISGDRSVWLRLTAHEARTETIVYLRFVDGRGQTVLERRLSIAPGQTAVNDVTAYGLEGIYTLEIVADRKVLPTLSQPAELPERERREPNGRP
jgi:PKD domain-containing protein